jgi:dTDP-4-amino-4,6-dideoxygalactose transaminase
MTTREGHGSRPRRASFLLFGQPAIEEEDIAEVVATLRSGWIGTGPKVQALEERFRSYADVSQAVAVSSCTAGLHLALDVLGVGPGDEVITSPMTFAATANVIIHRGATPVFADIERASLNVSPLEIERRITPRTRVILPVHMAGRACAMDEILALAEHHRLAVVSDAAHALEARYRGRSVAGLGDLAVFSFYVTKNVTTGEGGMISTASADWAEEIRVKRLHGLSRDAWQRYLAEGLPTYETIYPGYKYNLTDLEASLGLHQLERVERNWLVRQRLSERYRSALADLDEVLLPAEDSDPTNRHGRHLFVVLLNLEALRIGRDQFAAALKAENIGSGVHFTALHLHRYYAETFGFRLGNFPNAEWVGERTLSLPLSAGLTDQDVDDVIHAVRRLVRIWRR